LLLALDTATRTIGIALHDGVQVQAECLWLGHGHHTLELAPEVGMMLRRAGTSPASLTAVAVSLGPGSFNGLRIGLALAKGLALAHNLPLIGIPTLDILARSQPKRDGPMLAVIEAGRGRLAGVWYKSGRSGWQAEGEAESLTWEEVVSRLQRVTYVCGEIGPEGRQALAGERWAALAPPWMCVRRPGFLAELAWERLRAGKTADAASLAPIYLRPRIELTP
jgi:tRNA threonylcarbamoyladenosine biosynthesis protein TsaB